MVRAVNSIQFLNGMSDLEEVLVCMCQPMVRFVENGTAIAICIIPNALSIPDLFVCTPLRMVIGKIKFTGYQFTITQLIFSPNVLPE